MARTGPPPAPAALPVPVVAACTTTPVATQDVVMEPVQDVDMHGNDDGPGDNSSSSFDSDSSDDEIDGDEDVVEEKHYSQHIPPAIQMELREPENEPPKLEANTGEAICDFLRAFRFTIDYRELNKLVL
jgi:hypothetical protein